MTPAGIEPATFRLVAHRLNHCATAVPIYIHIFIFICLFILLSIFFPQFLYCNLFTCISSFISLYFFLNSFSLSSLLSLFSHCNTGIRVATLHRHAVCRPLSSIRHAMPTAKVTRRLTPRQHQRRSTVTPTVPENTLLYES